MDCNVTKDGFQEHEQPRTQQGRLMYGQLSPHDPGRASDGSSGADGQCVSEGVRGKGASKAASMPCGLS